MEIILLEMLLAAHYYFEKAVHNHFKFYVLIFFHSFYLYINLRFEY